MKQLLFFMITGLLSFTSPLATQCLAADIEDEVPTTLYGVKLYNASGGSTGLYSIAATPGAQPQLEWADGDMMGTAGAVYADGKLYVLTYLDFWGMTLWGFQICDVEQKTYDFIEPTGLEPVHDVSGALTYDPSTATVYCVCLADETGYNFNLCTMDLTSGKKTPVANLTQRLFCLATTAGGTIYGVGADGILYIVDKYSGGLTPIGSTGIIPTVNQSAVIDYKTGVMYWSAYSEEGGGLFTVDTATGIATEVTHFDDGYQFTGLFLKQKATPSSAPEAVGNLEAVFDGASLDGVVSFILPDRDIDGNPLSGSISWEISSQGNILASGTASPGERLEIPVSVEGGSTRFVVVPKCGDTPGQASNIELWIGMDTPKAVTDCTISLEGNLVRMEWILPEKGIHNGFVDHNMVRYVIDRGPEDVNVTSDHEGTIFEESVIRNGVYPVLYRITPYIGELAGEAIVSDYVRVGDHYLPPFTIDFTDPFNSLTVDIVDANDDWMTWCYDYDMGAMWCEWPISEDRCRDDWMITSPFLLKPGFYNVAAAVASEGKWNYNEQCYDDVYAGDFAVYVSSSPDVSGMTSNVIPLAPLESVEGIVRTGLLTIEEEGLYHFGLHLSGFREFDNIYNAIVNAFSVSETTSACTLESKECPIVRSFYSGIEVTNPANEHVTITSIDGRLIHSSSLDSITVTLSKGTYIVAFRGKSIKVMVH